MTKIYDAANWAEPEDNFSQMFYEQLTQQFWLPEEISLNSDLLTWKTLSREEQDTYKKALAGLTLLDTEQGEVGMAKIALHTNKHQRKAVLNFITMTENCIHAKSYSNIFLTLANKEEIKELFNWIKNDKALQLKTSTIVDVYNQIKDDEILLYKAMVASCFLETMLFYSSFYYPLYFYGQGKLMQCGEIINLIIRDESVHGVYVGLLAQEIFNKQTKEVQEELDQFTHNLLNKLYNSEMLYTANLYDQVDLTHDVKKFVRYNANKALMNLGYDPYFEEEEINSVVMNGLDTKTKTFDFFSMKGSSYKEAVVEELQDEDFIFDQEDK